jgi:hypothetical protein
MAKGALSAVSVDPPTTSHHWWKSTARVHAGKYELLPVLDITRAALRSSGAQTWQEGLLDPS